MTRHDPHLNLGWLTHSFAPISLEDLNAKAEMLSRIDNKYVVKANELQRAIPELEKEFDVLDINQQRAFTYDTRYFDDAQRSAYYEHHQGLRKGFKVRIRRYVDTDLCFLEVKVKGKRGMTEKYRLPYDVSQIEDLTDDARNFARETYSNQYGKPFRYDLRRVLDIRYKRVTLVAKTGGERMTIDTDLQFRSAGKFLNVGSDVFIVETKSQLGRGYADRCLRRVNVRLTKRCSKYCIGMATLGEVTRYNRFIPAMKKLDVSGVKSARPADKSTSLRDLFPQSPDFSPTPTPTFSSKSQTLGR